MEISDPQTHALQLTGQLPNSRQIDDAVLDAIEQRWIDRCKSQHRATKGKPYERLELEFFVGALSALIAADPTLQVCPRWVIACLSGDRIVKADRFK